MKQKSSKLHDHIGYWLKRLSNLVHDSFKAKLERMGVSISEWCVLVVLYHAPDATSAELAAEIGIDRAAISRTVERLVQNKKIIRQVGKDRRQTPLMLTEQSRALVKSLAALADENDREFFSTLSQEETNLLKGMLLKLFHNYQEKKEI